MHTLFVVVIALAALATVFALGPRASLETSTTAKTITGDPDQWVRQSESAFTDIVDGAEKTISWADPTHKQKTPLAFIYLHGFSATRQETQPVTDRLAQHFDSNVFYTRLAGHGRTDDAMLDGSVKRWTGDLAEAMAIGATLGEKVVIVATSTGASLAWWGANQAQYKEQIAALILLSPNFGVRDPNAELLLLPWGATIARMVIGPYRSFTPDNETQAKYWTYRYPTQALLPMMGLVKLAREYPAELMTTPAFFLYSPHDDTVDPQKIEEKYEQLTSKKQRLVIDDPQAESQHVIVGDIMAPQNNEKVLSTVISFLQETVVAPPR